MCALGALLLGATPATGQDFVTELQRGLVDEAALTVHLRSYYFDRAFPAPPSAVAWAGGGWIGYETGWLLDVFRFGAVGYTSQPMAAGATNGTLLLYPGQNGPYGYTVLGQAYGQMRFRDQQFSAYRQLINQPEVNPQDNRMTPNTFEAYLFSGSFGAFSYLGGYVDKMKPRNAVEFIDMAKAAGGPDDVKSGMWLGGIDYRPSAGPRLRLSGYSVQDILSSGYGDFAWSHSITDDVDVNLRGQFMAQGSNGANKLTGEAFGTWVLGAGIDFSWRELTLVGSFTQTAATAPYRNPYGLWPGYSNMMLRQFHRANESAFTTSARIDFAAINLPGLAFVANVTLGSGAIDPATRLPLSTDNEYDFTLDFMLADSAIDFPDALRPLWIRARSATLNRFQNGAVSTVRDFRVILNYEWKFGGRTR